MTETDKSRVEVTLIPIPQSVSIARLFVRHRLLCFGFEDLLSDAETVASELVTNAVKVTATGNQKTQGHIRMHLGLHEGRPLLEIWDSAPSMPVLKEPDFVAESGRGLHIVKSLSAGLGWRRDEERGGKTVWALLK